MTRAVLFDLDDTLVDQRTAARAAGLRAVLVDRADEHAATDVPRVRSLHHLTFTA